MNVIDTSDMPVFTRVEGHLPVEGLQKVDSDEGHLPVRLTPLTVTRVDAGDATAPDAGAATKVAEDAAVDTLAEALAVDLTVAEGKLTLALALAQTRAPLTL